MIIAEFRETDGGRISLVISGHSGYSAPGGDIVCAAVSGIFFALTGYLSAPSSEQNEKIKKDNYTGKTEKNDGGICIINDVRPGYADIECDAAGKEALRMACIGLLQISERYPAYLTVRNCVWESYICPYVEKIKETGR